MKRPEPGTASAAYYREQSVYWAAQGKPLIAQWCARLADRLAGGMKA